jgi:hypothetical protein
MARRVDWPRAGSLCSWLPAGRILIWDCLQRPAAVRCHAGVLAVVGLSGALTAFATQDEMCCLPTDRVWFMRSTPLGEWLGG